MKLFNKYKFSDKSQTLGGTISTVMGVAALSCLLYGVFVAFKKSGEAGLEVGSLGLNVMRYHSGIYDGSICHGSWFLK